MKYEYHPHWTQPLLHLRILLLLPPAAELMRRGAGFSAGILLLILWGIQYLPRLYVSPGHITFRSLQYRSFCTPPSVVEAYRPLHLRLLGSVPVRLYFSAHPVPDRRSVALSVRSARQLHRALCPAVTSFPHGSGKWARLLAAAFQPHLAAGWALTVSLLRGAAPSPLAAAFLRSLPPSISGALARLPAPWVILTGTAGVVWFISFLRRLEESACPRLYAGTDVLAVQCGLLTRRSRVFFLRRCPGMELRQHFLLTLCGIASIYICTGRRVPSLLLPAVQKKAFTHTLFRQHFARSVVVAPPQTARSRFGRVQLILLAALAPVCVWASAREALLLQYGCIAAGLDLCLRLWAQQCAFSRTMVRLDAEQLAVCRCKGLSVVTTVVSRSAIAAAAVRSHWFQRRAGLCSLQIFVPGVPVLQVKHLRQEDGLRILRSLTGIQ